MAHGVVLCAASGASSWLAPLITLGTATVAGLITLHSIDSARQLARRKATLDLIEKAESSDHYRTLTDAFVQVRRSNGFAYLVRPTDPPSKTIRGQVLDYMNHYELVSIGIGKDILDEGMYRAWMQTAFIRDWNAAALWVQSIRIDPALGGRAGYDDRPFQAYQQLALAWSRGTAVRLTPRTPPLIHVDAPVAVSDGPAAP